MSKVTEKLEENLELRLNNLQAKFFWDGFFYFFGFIDNPAKEKINQVISSSINQQIKSDLDRINRSYKKQYEIIRKEAFGIE